MGMYFERLLESDNYQDPNNTGIDLDEVEAQVDAEREDLNDEAESGVVGDDPIDEAFMIMYESTYNYNQLMQRIGMVELNEAVSGRDFILEAVDIKGFFETVKTILTNMFRAVTKAFKNVLNRMVTAVSSDKKLIAEHESAIRAGYKTEWSFEGYEFKNESIVYDCTSVLDKMTNGCKSALESLKRNGSYDEAAVEALTDHSKIIESNAKVAADDISDMRKKLQEKYFGGKTKTKFGKDGKDYPGGVDGVIALLKADKETKAIKEGYNKIKKDYKKALDNIEGYRKAITSKDYNGDSSLSKAFSVCEKFSNATVFEKNVQNTVYHTCMAAARAKRAQARRIALVWQRAATKNNLDSKYPKIQHNSADMFGSIKLV